MKYFILFLFYIINCLFCLAQNINNLEKDKSILWEISKNGSHQKSYLLGTYHGGFSNKISYSFLDSLQHFKDILKNVDAVGVECNFEDSLFVKMQIDNLNNCIHQKYPAYAYLPDSVKRFSQLFTDTIEYDFVNSFLQELKGKKILVPNDYNRLKPVFTIQMINNSIQIIKEVADRRSGTVFINIDSGIYNRAKQSGKHLFFMESTQYHINLLNEVQSFSINSYSLQEQSQALYYYCKDLKEGLKTSKSYEKRLQRLYMEGDLKGMQYLEDSYFSDLKQRLDFTVIDNEITVERNKNWIPIILTNIDRYSCLIAVGVMHLPGENGLISLLKEKGYQVNPVNIYSK